MNILGSKVTVGKWRLVCERYTYANEGLIHLFALNGLQGYGKLRNM